ncbi:N-acetylmuramic acid 6-phosphate etherase [Actinopolymorpha pittospori]|uniref:N-acetylmuramic acid 6-phosphate etherase n=1 Tax=Actinopolymorpha pittospori TaxID=648752 RepID=A0A927RLI6_9ACTN|nr:N-acetylmuramic acid 6-phosphate etherase [Actinopolymorpha pittospori]MBE1607878.1 N-acetylmuramic acid 6-phosphate etherase [Actinopolymorpha pittospori]
MPASRAGVPDEPEAGSDGHDGTAPVPNAAAGGVAGTPRRVTPPFIRVDSPTEARNPRTVEIDRLPTLEVLHLINDEDQQVARAVWAALPKVAAAVDLAVRALQEGRRIHYVGAGTSGRLAVLDAAELPPTFAVPHEWFVTHAAGGPAAFLRAIEGAEDDEDAGAREMIESVQAGDVVMGLAASGRTPYVVGALRASRARGAATVFVTANPAASLGTEVDVFVPVDTGPEVVAGSTRMKAGTAQKLVLNAFSTAVMVRIGRTYSNLMVDLMATNAKLRGRMLEILAEATGKDEHTCAQALREADGELKTALVAVLGQVSSERARRALRHAHGHVHVALAEVGRA